MMFRRQGSMRASEAPSQFMAKTWIFVVQVIVLGSLAIFSLIFGPLFLFGYMNKANGAPATDAGIALSAMSLPLLLVSALAAYNLRTRRRPLLQLCREGIVIVQIGPSSLDGIPLIPGMIRMAWLIISTQGFRQRVICIPWAGYQDAWVSGPPMAHHLTILASLVLASEEALPLGWIPAEQVVLDEVSFVESLDQICEAIKFYGSSPTTRRRLPSWHEGRQTAA
jgi:hypothetical protein